MKRPETTHESAAKFNDLYKGARVEAAQCIEAAGIAEAIEALNKARAAYIDGVEAQEASGYVQMHNGIESDRATTFCRMLEAYRHFTDRCVDAGYKPEFESDSTPAEDAWCRAVAAAVDCDHDAARSASHDAGHAAQRSFVEWNSHHPKDEPRPAGLAGMRYRDQLADDAAVRAKRLAAGRAPLPEFRSKADIKADKGWKREARGVLPKMRPAQ
jgi:hypothetical protein